MNNKSKPLAVLCAIYSVAAILVFLPQLFFQNSDTILFLFFCTVCGLIFTLPLIYKNNMGFAHPFVFLFLTVFMGVTLRGYLMVYMNDDEQINSTFLLNKNIAYFTYPTFLLLLSLILFFLGYYSINSKINFNRFKLFKQDYEWNQARVNFLVVLFFAISAVGFSFYLKTLGIKNIMADLSSKRLVQIGEGEQQTVTSYGYLRLLSNFIEPLMYVYMLNFIHQKKKIISFAGLVLIVIGLANLFMPFFTSSRSSMIIFFINLFIILSFTNKLNARVLAPLAIIPVLLFSVITYMRNTKQNSVDISQLSLVEPFIYNKNLLDVAKTCHILNGVPSKMPYEPGVTLYALICAPIPRVWWPGKPNVSIGSEVVHKIYDVPTRIITDIPPGLPGELYVNGALPGMLLGFLLFGMLLKKLVNGLEFEKSFNKNRIILYVMIVVRITITMLGSSINQAVISILSSFIPLYIALKLVTDYKKPIKNSSHAG